MKAYIMDPDPVKECQINVQLLERGVLALEHLSPKLEFVALPTGTKVCFPSIKVKTRF